MAFPSVAAKGTTYNTLGTATTDHVIDLPDNLVAGDRVLICLGLRTTTAFTWPTSPAWTQVAAQNAPTSGGRLEIRYRDVDGTEGWNNTTSSITVTTGSSIKGCGFPWKITGFNTASAPEATTAQGSATSTPDPPSLGPTWGAEDNLWITVCYSNGNNTTTTYPLLYLDNQENAATTGASSASDRICSRNVNAATEDPGSFTLDGSQNCALATIAIRPTAGAATNLVVQDATQAQTSDNIVLTQVHEFAVQNAVQAQTSDNVVLTQDHILVVQDAVQAQVSDNLTLSFPSAGGTLCTNDQAAQKLIALYPGSETNVGALIKRYRADNNLTAWGAWVAHLISVTGKNNYPDAANAFWAAL